MMRTFDIDQISAILKHPDIWPAVSDESQDIDEFKPPMDNSIHYLIDEGALLILHPDGDNMEVHVNILPEYRGKAKELCFELIEYARSLGVTTLSADIPIEYGNVYNFALKFMKDRGIIDGEHHLDMRV